MASKLYSQTRNNGKSNFINQIKGITNQPSDALFNQMYSTNPAFRQFADSMRGVSPEEAFRQHGLDFSDFRGLKW